MRKLDGNKYTTRPPKNIKYKLCLNKVFLYVYLKFYNELYELVI